MTKTCSQCKREKPASEFSPNGSRLRAACKVCEASNKRNIREVNGEHVRAVSRQHMAKSPEAREQRRLASKAWWDSKRADGTISDIYRKHTYGLTPERHRDLCEAYPVCGICGRDTHMKTDHCHETGKVRGRLCTGCNTAIGRLGDNIPGLMRAIEYLANPRF